MDTERYNTDRKKKTNLQFKGNAKKISTSFCRRDNFMLRYFLAKKYEKCMRLKRQGRKSNKKMWEQSNLIHNSNRYLSRYFTVPNDTNWNEFRNFDTKSDLSNLCPGNSRAKEKLNFYTSETTWIYREIDALFFDLKKYFFIIKCRFHSKQSQLRPNWKTKIRFSGEAINQTFSQWWETGF